MLFVSSRPNERIYVHVCINIAGRADAINAQSMNGWIQHHVSRLRRTGNPNWDWAFHGEPQTSYMYYRNGTAKVQHILHFEALDEEFDQLMKVGVSLSLSLYISLVHFLGFFFRRNFDARHQSAVSWRQSIDAVCVTCSRDLHTIPHSRLCTYCARRTVLRN